MNNKRNKIITLATLFLLLVLVFVLQLGGGKTGTVSISVATPDAVGLKATLNGTSVAVSNQSKTFKLEPGAYDLLVSKPNYATYKSSFTLTEKTDLVITVPLHRVMSAELLSWQQVAGGDAATPGAKLTAVSYFYDKTWAVAVINYNGNIGQAILKFDDTTNKWTIVSGPSTLFTKESVRSVPVKVQEFLNKNHYIESGNL
ncbi:MAG: hypothetical protein QFB87_00745 [Patescibacteria group bacterium]|nr:hypothetical protein [Patescibacteria group bacterium]